MNERISIRKLYKLSLCKLTLCEEYAVNVIKNLPIFNTIILASSVLCNVIGTGRKRTGFHGTKNMLKESAFIVKKNLKHHRLGIQNTVPEYVWQNQIFMRNLIRNHLLSIKEENALKRKKEELVKAYEKHIMKEEKNQLDITEINFQKENSQVKNILCGKAEIHRITGENLRKNIMYGGAHYVFL